MIQNDNNGVCWDFGRQHVFMSFDQTTYSPCVLSTTHRPAPPPSPPGAVRTFRVGLRRLCIRHFVKETQFSYPILRGQRIFFFFSEAPPPAPDSESYGTALDRRVKATFPTLCLTRLRALCLLFLFTPLQLAPR